LKVIILTPFSTADRGGK